MAVKLQVVGKDLCLGHIPLTNASHFWINTRHSVDIICPSQCGEGYETHLTVHLETAEAVQEFITTLIANTSAKFQVPQFERLIHQDNTTILTFTSQEAAEQFSALFSSENKISVTGHQCHLSQLNPIQQVFQRVCSQTSRIVYGGYQRHFSIYADQILRTEEQMKCFMTVPSSEEEVNAWLSLPPQQALKQSLTDKKFWEQLLHELKSKQQNLPAHIFSIGKLLKNDTLQLPEAMRILKALVEDTTLEVSAEAVNVWFNLPTQQTLTDKKLWEKLLNELKSKQQFINTLLKKPAKSKQFLIKLVAELELIVVNAFKKTQL